MSSKVREHQIYFPDITFNGQVVNFEYDPVKFYKLSFFERCEIEDNYREIFKKVQKIYNKKFKGIISEIAKKENLKPCEVKTLMTVDECVMKIYPSKTIRFDVYYNLFNGNFKLYNGHCVMVHFTIEDGKPDICYGPINGDLFKFFITTRNRSRNI